MRATGKYWWLLVISNGLTVVASLLIMLWKSETGNFELWFDIVPSGFGYSSVLTGTLIAMVASVSREDMAVATGITYLFRTVAQVLGVSLSGALVQGVLLRELRSKITEPGSDELINKIRHSTAFIRTLHGKNLEAAIESYKTALRLVFLCQAAVCIISVIMTLPIQQRTLSLVFNFSSFSDF